MPVGTCALCLSQGVELQDSHIIPKWAYKRLRGSAPNPDPVQFDGTRALQTSRQLKQYLLCRGCEDRFSQYETIVAQGVHQDDGTFPFRDNLGGELAGSSVRSKAREPGNVDCRPLIYFGASVFWRASHSCGATHSDLGPYAEPFRQYLLGVTEFPGKAAMSIGVSAPHPTDSKLNVYRAFTVPTSERVGRCHFHRFILCGVTFGMWVGGQLPEFLQSFCVVRGTTPAIFVGDMDDLLAQIAPAILSSKPNKKLAVLGGARPS